MWEQRKTELVPLARDGPVVVYNGETLNELVFDALFLEQVNALVHRLSFCSHPAVLEAMARTGASFSFRNEREWRTLQAAGFSTNASPLIFDYRPGLSPFVPGPHAVLALPVNLAPEILLTEARLFRAGKMLLRISSLDDAGADAEKALAMLAASGLRPGGAYLASEVDVSTCLLQDVIRELGSVLGPFDPLVLGGGLGVSYSAATGRMDPKATAESLAEVREAAGGASLWLEPGMAFLRPAGALLMPVRTARPVGEGVVIQVDDAVRGILTEAVSDGKRTLFNLSRGLEVHLEETHASTPTKVPQGIHLAGSQRPRVGDILLLPFLSLPKHGTVVEPLPGALPFREHYLNARRICQVPI